MLCRLKIATRVNLIPLLVAFGVLASSAIGLWTLRSQLLEDRRVQLRNLLDLTLSIARADMKAAGGPASDAGRKAFLSVLHSTRFGDEAEANYIFAYDYDGGTLSHVDPHKIGQNRLDTVYPNGVKVVRKFIGIALSAAGTGYIEYPMEKGAGGPVTQKLTLVQNVPEINGVAGVGVYIDDVNAVFIHRLLIEAGFLSAVLIVITVLSYLIGRSISKPLSNLAGRIARLAEGDLNVSSKGSDEATELGAIARTVEVLRQNAIQQKALQEKVSEVQQREQERQHYFEANVREFQKIVTAVVAALGQQVEQLHNSAETLSSRWHARWPRFRALRVQSRPL